jgi:CheY-like chemotaxis protein
MQINGLANNQETNSKKRVLLAEDDAAVRRLLQIVLERAGYEVFPAEDGLAAMQTAGTTEFDVAVLDAVMPNLSGYELCRIFRSHPTWQNIPLIVLSGMEPERNAEADICLTKTAQMQDELLNAISNLLANRH